MLFTMQLGQLGRSIITAGTATPHYWNPSDCASEITLSAGNATSTRSTTNNTNWRSVRSVTSHNSGKWYAECLNIANGSANGSMIFGVGKSAASLGSNPGSDANSWGNQANNPSVFFYIAGTPINESSGYTAIGAGGYAKLAIDFGAGKIFFGTSATTGGGGWGSGVDPTSGAGGFSFTAGTTLFLMLGMYSNPQQCTLRTAAADMAGTIPSGYSAWG